MKTMTFLTNSRGKKAVRRRAVTRRTKRRPPKGFSTWKAYMASIRPNGRKKKRAATRSTPSRGSAMASKKTRPGKRHSAPRRTVHRSRARHRRNAPMMSGALGFAQTAVVGAAQVLAGKILVRKTRAMAGQKAGTLLGSIMEAGVGIAAGMLVSRTVSREAGERVAIGGFLAPMETLVQQLAIPYISDSLGDDGYELTGDLGYVVADDDDRLSGVDDVNVLGDEDDLAGYVGRGDDLGGYVGSEQYEEGAA